MRKARAAAAAPLVTHAAVLRPAIPKPTVTGTKARDSADTTIIWSVKLGSNASVGSGLGGESVVETISGPDQVKVFSDVSVSEPFVFDVCFAELRTDAMGRLTMNLLASFAEFEREMISERTRDKIAGARRKGKWTGGPVPFGYSAKDKKLLVNEAEVGAELGPDLGAPLGGLDQLDDRARVAGLQGRHERLRGAHRALSVLGGEATGG